MLNLDSLDVAQNIDFQAKDFYHIFVMPAEWEEISTSQTQKICVSPRQIQMSEAPSRDE